MQFLILVLTTVFFQPLLAQDISLQATFDSVKLSGGFSPDPMKYDVISGGSIDASKLGKNCNGYIANAPDFQLTFEAGILELWVSIISSVDTTLVVNTPSGEWTCDDDSGGDMDPSIHFSDAPSGVFDVWIGTYDSTSTHEATLYISELGAYGN
jgi:hypothetical protein